MSSVWINDFCSRPRRACPDTILPGNVSQNGVFSQAVRVFVDEAKKFKYADIPAYQAGKVKELVL